MPRFVILEHDHPRLHWDFMLEWNGSLRTWRLDKRPPTNEPIDATPLPNHRLAYLDYQGPVRGNRGTVRRWESGSYRLLSNPDDPITVQVELDGARLVGIASLEHDTSGVCKFRFHPTES